jgi:hypothetical protein
MLRISMSTVQVVRIFLCEAAHLQFHRQRSVALAPSTGLPDSKATFPMTMLTVGQRGERCCLVLRRNFRFSRTCSPTWATTRSPMGAAGVSFVCFDRKPPYAKGDERRDGPIADIRNHVFVHATQGAGRLLDSVIGKSCPWPSGTFERVTRRLDAAKL